MLRRDRPRIGSAVGGFFVVPKKIRQKVRIEENLCSAPWSEQVHTDVFRRSCGVPSSQPQFNHHGEFSSLCGPGSWGSCFMQRIR